MQWTSSTLADHAEIEITFACLNADAHGLLGQDAAVMRITQNALERLSK